MSLKFYFDTHIARQVAVQLRERGVDVVRCEEVGMAEAEDEALLNYAVQGKRALVSMDEDFQGWHFRWLEASKAHCGIFKISHDLEGEGGIGQIVKELFAYYELVEVGAATLENDIYQQLFFIRQEIKMTAIIPMHYIEMVEKNDRAVIRIAGTRFRVADIVLMHVKNHSPIEWIVDNFESLNYAKIHAALAYYYDHQTEIEAEIQVMVAADEAIRESAISLEDLKAKIEAQRDQQ